MSYTLLNVLLGSTVLGITGGVVGSFALLRRQSLLGDALAHAALPGVCLAFLVTGVKSPLALLAGAMVTGLLGAAFVTLVVRGSRIKEDAAIGIVLSVFFAIGIVLITRIQRLPWGNQSGLDKYLFGQAATIVGADVLRMSVLGGVVLLLVALFHKELKLLCFDREFGSSLGLPMAAVEALLTCLLVAVVVLGLQTVGVVLVVATLITPAAAARQWTDRLGMLLLLAAAIGAFSGSVGTLVSASTNRLPPGPTIVLVSSLALVVSLFLAPRRGLLWARLRELGVKRRIRRENLLKDLYLVGERAGAWDRYVAPPALMGLRGQGVRELEGCAGELVAAGLAERAVDSLRLTRAGIAAAERLVRKHRLWEVYLTRRLELPVDHVHRDAEAMEHALSDDVVDALEARLGHPLVDPHGRPIPPRRPA